MDWIAMAQDRYRRLALGSAEMNLRVPQNMGSCWTSWGAVSFLGRTLLHGGREVGRWGKVR
jgi:hypothetical protein